MQPARISPRVHIFVCANRRGPDAPFGPGCGEVGERVFTSLKTEVARRGLLRGIWITQTRCLGLCPRRGAAVAIYPHQQLWTEVDPTEAATLIPGTLADPSNQP